MTPDNALVLLILTLMIGGILYGLGRIAGWSILWCYFVGSAIIELSVRLIKVPLKKLGEWSSARTLNRLLLETEKADARRKLVRDALVPVDSRNIRVLPVRLITNPMIQ